MKQLKLLPTILMLVLCVGVLAIGIYAITPTKNTISGSITINASNQPVLIELFIDGVSQGEPQTVRSVKTWNVGDLEFVTTGKNTIDEVAGRTVTLRITNQSTTQSLGAYFFKNGTESSFSDGFATGDNIMLEDVMYVDGSSQTEEADKIATVECTPYMYIAKNDDATTTNTIFDYVDMTLEFKPYQFMTGTGTYKSTINYSLNIEPYQANVAVSADNNPNNLPVITPGTITVGEYLYNVESAQIELTKSHSVTNGTTDFNQKLLKLPENLTTLKPASFYGNTNIEHIVVPANVANVEFARFYSNDDPDGIGSQAFACPNLKVVSWCADTELDAYSLFFMSCYCRNLGVISNTNNPVNVYIKATIIHSEVAENMCDYVSCFAYCNLGKVVLLNEDTIIEEGAFYS